MSQIATDIEKRILDKLSLWMTDSFALCEMAHMRKGLAATIVMRALLYALITGLMQKGAKKTELLEVVSTNWDMVHEMKTQAGWKAKPSGLDFLG